MSRIAITGAAGRIGGEALTELTDHDLTAIDVEPVDDDHATNRELDITTGVDPLEDAFEDHDIVIHLAAHADPYKDWEGVLNLNIGGTYNTFEAARRAGVNRVVFASSNHVMHMHNIDDPTGPETMVEDARAVSTDDVPAPDSYYGTSKLWGEGLSRMYADRYGIEFVNLRIGWYLTPDQLREFQDEPDNIARYARAMFLSPRDCRHVLRRAVEADIPENPLNVHVTSRNGDHYLSLTETMRSLDYRPQDDASEIVAVD